MVAARDELCGRTVGEFILRERIGEGGFGAVYRCEQPLLGREAVVKVLHGRLRASDVVIQRFLREARLASRIDHPYAAHVYAFGVEKDDGLLWIAMERVHGTPLDRWLRERGPLALDQLVPFFERLAEVVHTAHEAGIVHRDLKPSNVMVIERAGRLLPKLLDLGIAKNIGDSPAASPEAGAGRAAVVLAGGADSNALGLEQTAQLDQLPRRRSEEPTRPAGAETGPAAAAILPALTQAGTAMGSPPYMAPEQWASAGAVGPGADIYALGILAYEALTGRLPFVASSSVGYAALHSSGPVPPLGSDQPAALDRFFQRALAKNPGDRPGTALELAAALRIAAGIGEQPVDLPRLDEGVREAWLADAPQPLAEAIAAVDGARNAHQAREAAWDLFRGVVRYLTAIGLSARAHVHAGQDAPILLDQLRDLGQRDLDDGARVQLLRALTAPFVDRRDAHPVPELVDLWTPAAGSTPPLHRLIDLRDASDAGLDDDQVRSQLARLLPELSRLLRAVSFILDYPLVVPRDGALERWTGLRRMRRPLAAASGLTPTDRQPLLVDRDGRAVLLLWPVCQVLAPVAGGADELFIVDGRGRHGMRLISAPAGFERQDPGLQEWLGGQVAGGEETAADEERGPYLGLASFSLADADRFIGRERETEVLVNRLRQQPLQIVVGPSGAGKSSFVHAGVVPALPPSWRMLSMRPGAAPLGNASRCLHGAGFDPEAARRLVTDPPAATAALSLAAGGSGFVLVVDQLEELFTLCADDGERHCFAELLDALSTSADNPIRVIVTVRDDFLMRLESLSPLRARVSTSLFLLGNPVRDDLVRAVVEPARRAGYQLSDPDLAGEMADAVADRPGALALLSFTAARLWELRDRRFRQLGRKAYEAMGGVGGALGRHAEEVLEQMPADDRRLVRAAFHRLVTADGTRAVLTAGELVQLLDNPRAQEVIDRLVAARLLVVREGDEASGAQVEIAHEALIGAWQRLAGWLREDSERARMHDQLRGAARQWTERGRPRGLLWRDELLADLERWRREGLSLTDAERAFADASAREAGRARRLRRLAVGVAFVILAAAVLLLLRLNTGLDRERSRAKDLAGQAERSLVEQYVEHARQAFVAGDGLQALAYVDAAARAGDDSTAIRYIAARASRPVLAELARGDQGAQIDTVAVSPDGARLVTGTSSGDARVWDTSTGKPLAELKGASDAIWDLQFDTAGQRVVASSWDGTARIYSVDGVPLAVLRGHGSAVMDATFVGGDRVVTGSHDGTARVWDARTGVQLLALDHPGPVERVNVQPGAAAVATGGRDGVVRLWDVRSGHLTASLQGHTGAIRGLAFSPDGKYLITTGVDKTARIWEVGGARSVATLTGHLGAVTSIAIAPTGDRLVTGSEDGTARVWSLPAGELLAVLAGHEGSLGAVFDDAGTRVVTAGWDGSIRVWAMPRGNLLHVLAGHADRVTAAAFAAQGDRLVSAGYDGTVRIWSLARLGDRLLKVHDEVGGAAVTGPSTQVVSWGPDGVAAWDPATGRMQRFDTGPIAEAALFAGGRRLLGADPDGKVVVVDLASGSRLAERQHGGKVVHVRAASAADRVATGGADGRVVVWSGRTLDAEVRLDHGERLWTLAWTADGRTLISTGDSYTRVWRVPEGRLLHQLGEHEGFIIASDIAADGRMLVTASVDGTARIWDLASGRPLHVLSGHRGRVQVARFSPDGGRVVTGGQEGTAMVWDVRSGQALGTLARHGRNVFSATFSPDGRLVATTSIDRTAKIWDAERMQLLETLRGHTGYVLSAAFSADGAHLLTSSTDGTLGLWALAAAEPTTAIAARVVCRLPVAVTDGRLQRRAATQLTCP